MAPVRWLLDGWARDHVAGGLEHVAQLSSDSGHVCALNDQGTVVCWKTGGSAKIECGQASVPASLAAVAQIAAGTYHMCAVALAGQLSCWGRNEGGQTDLPADLGPVLQVSVGRNRTSAIDAQHMRCWGEHE